MTGKVVLLDTMLLLLLLVGSVSRGLIAKHKRLTAYTAQDYDILVSILQPAEEIRVTPNTVTETSNLAKAIANPARRQIFEAFSQVLLDLPEEYVTSQEAATLPVFVRLGLTDAVLLQAATSDVVILTADLQLYLAALQEGREAVNFNHIRDTYL